MEDNRRGFHHPHNQGHDHNTGAQGRMEPPNEGRSGMKEPTNHAGHTYDKGRHAEHAARVERMRAAHGVGEGAADYHMGHERVLHETHKLHQGTFTSHGNKHGESHHLRSEAKAEGETEAFERKEHGY